MEKARKSVRCSYCGAQIMMPPYTHAIRCAVCQITIRIKPNDPLSQAHNSICHAVGRLKDLLNTASSNMSMMVATTNNYAGSGTSGVGYYPQVKPSASAVPVSAHGRKQAVLCGVSYYGKGCRLNG